ncbi:MAG: hypothetical protein FWD97_08655 [Defluviitaleaceae bacterium]|nr:hypothetical protein [Defluviitaleaceae bacterium]
MSYDPNKNGVDTSDYTRDNRTEATPPPHAPHPTHHPHPMPYGGGSPRKPSRFLLFILSGCVPGLGHMYLGMIRRGLFYMAGIALLVFLTVQLAISGLGIFTVFTGFGLLALYTVSFFESFIIRRDIVAGKEVADTIPSFVTDKRFLIAIGAVLGLTVLASIISVVPWFIWVAAGVVVIALVSKKKKSS